MSFLQPLENILQCLVGMFTGYPTSSEAKWQAFIFEASLLGHAFSTPVSVPQGSVTLGAVPHGFYISDISMSSYAIKIAR